MAEDKVLGLQTKNIIIKTLKMPEVLRAAGAILQVVVRQVPTIILIPTTVVVKTKVATIIRVHSTVTFIRVEGDHKTNLKTTKNTKEA